ncbi:Delta(1)-pyrroline-2-carboxylate reductase [Senna tora]|uniref:Delta(1)-pyrroline-2-carboxylate reductase n=1 Tax=Senna tora TaxID=362788 RepID=A0A834TEF6_9FABA|nr:Delta(1)-pyrroline-2-carboxylate reductase [Senna tora]
MARGLCLLNSLQSNLLCNSVEIWKKKKNLKEGKNLEEPTDLNTVISSELVLPTLSPAASSTKLPSISSFLITPLSKAPTNSPASSMAASLSTNTLPLLMASSSHSFIECLNEPTKSKCAPAFNFSPLTIPNPNNLLQTSITFKAHPFNPNITFLQFLGQFLCLFHRAIPNHHFSQTRVLWEMGHKLDAYVRERWGRGPRGHEKERGRRGNGVALTNWGLLEKILQQRLPSARDCGEFEGREVRMVMFDGFVKFSLNEKD